MSGRLNRFQATALYDSEFWRFLNAEQRACFQLSVDRLCMPFLEFHRAVELCLNRRVGAGEFLRPKALLDELTGKKPAPPIEEILELVPSEALPILVA